MTPPEILSSKNILELSKTPEGKKLLKETFLQARVAYSAQAIFEALQLTPTREQQDYICTLLYKCMFEIPASEVLEYVKSVRNHINENSINNQYIDPNLTGNC